MTIKLSDEQLTKWGVKSQEELISALDKTVEKPKAENLPVIPPTVPPAKDASEVSAYFAQHGIFQRIALIETSLGAINKDALIDAAKVEARKVASSEVSAAIARSGGQALKQESAPAEPPAGKTVDPNDFAAQYDASPNLQAEFISKTSFVKYQQAKAAGRIREHSARN